MLNESGTLYIVATPIGNLDDFSSRAVKILDTATYILAEDTRHSQVLLQYYHLQAKIMALTTHNEMKVTNRCIQDLQSGCDIAVISDAGTPTLNDPGHYLVVQAHKHKITVSPIPGCSSLIAALSASGVSSDRFIYEGFLPKQPSVRRKLLQKFSTETCTLVCLETPHRLLESLQDCIAILGAGRLATIAKEITKLHETVRHDSLGNLHRWFMDDSVRQKGEFVLVISGAEERKIDISTEALALLKLLLTWLPPRRAAQETAKIGGGNVNTLYKQALALKKQVSG